MAVVLPDADSAFGVVVERRGAQAGSARSLALTGGSAGPGSQADQGRLLAWTPQLAMGICSARGAQLLRLAADGSVGVVAAHGLPFHADSDTPQGPARCTIEL